MQTETLATDTLKRRLRHAKPQPIKQSLQLAERDVLIFEKLREHGPLPSNYLYEFTKHLRGHRPAFQRRLTNLYNGTKDCPAFLIRPPQQWASYNARYQPVIYDLGPRAERVLSEYGRFPSVERTDPFLHRLMGACVTSSIQLACDRRELRYISPSEIFGHPSCPDATRQSHNPLALPLGGNRTLIPDGLFGIEYPGAKPSYRFFAVEIDRNTESIERRSFDQNAYGRKLESYIHLLKQNAQKTHWGLPTLMVLTVTTNATHLANMLDYLRRLNEPRLSDRFLFRARPEFGVNWRVPNVMHDLLTEPWQRTDGIPFPIGST